MIENGRSEATIYFPEKRKGFAIKEVHKLIEEYSGDLSIGHVIYGVELNKHVYIFGNSGLFINKRKLFI